ncbi:MAG: hypothetical protein ACR2PT_13470 [Endozoicomonas sp.]
MVSVLRGRLRDTMYLLFSLQPAYLLAEVDCSTLDSSIDQKICQNVLADSYTPNSDAKAASWLNSVQKITAGTPITEGLLANPNRLYIFDHKTADGERAVYHLPPIFSMPPDSVFISNGTAESKPLFLAESDTITQFKAEYLGYNAVVNVEISTRFNERDHEHLVANFVVNDVKGATLSGVTLSASYKNANELFQLYLRYRNDTPTFFRIEDCDFILPDVNPLNPKIAELSAVSIQGTDNSLDYASKMTVTFKGNRIVSKDSYQSTDSKVSNAAFALMLTGLVSLPRSTCNSIMDQQGKSLLSDSNYLNWIIGVPATYQAQALGFRNGKGWGWGQTNEGVIKSIYATWNDWSSRYGINLNCTVPPRPPLKPPIYPPTRPSDIPSTMSSTSTPSDNNSSAELAFYIRGGIFALLLIVVCIIGAVAGTGG